MLKLQELRQNQTAQLQVSKLFRLCDPESSGRISRQRYSWFRKLLAGYTVAPSSNSYRDGNEILELECDVEFRGRAWMDHDLFLTSLVSLADSQGRAVFLQDFIAFLQGLEETLAAAQTSATEALARPSSGPPSKRSVVNDPVSLTVSPPTPHESRDLSRVSHERPSPDTREDALDELFLGGPAALTRPDIQEHQVHNEQTSLSEGPSRCGLEPAQHSHCDCCGRCHHGHSHRTSCVACCPLCDLHANVFRPKPTPRSTPHNRLPWALPLQPGLCVARDHELKYYLDPPPPPHL